MDSLFPDDIVELPHSSHWGAFSVRRRAHENERDIEIVPHPPPVLLDEAPVLPGRCRPREPVPP